MLARPRDGVTASLTLRKVSPGAGRPYSMQQLLTVELLWAGSPLPAQKSTPGDPDKVTHRSARRCLSSDGVSGIHELHYGRDVEQ